MNANSVFIETDSTAKVNSQIFDFSSFPKELPSELVMNVTREVNVSDNSPANQDRINEILHNSGYKVVNEQLKDRVNRLFCEIYILNKDDDIDLHSTFAKKLGISRANAKELAKRLYFDSKIIRLVSGVEDIIEMDSTSKMN